MDTLFSASTRTAGRSTSSPPYARRAAIAGMALSDYLIREVGKIAAYPSAEEMRERLFHRDPYHGKTSPTDLVRAERDAR